MKCGCSRQVSKPESADELCRTFDGVSRLRQLTECVRRMSRLLPRVSSERLMKLQTSCQHQELSYAVIVMDDACLPTGTITRTNSYPDKWNMREGSLRLMICTHAPEGAEKMNSYVR